MGAIDDYTLAGDPTVGPTGAVCWASHVPSGRVVAVTELTDAAVADEAFMDRLRSTVTILAGVADPHVVPIREVVEGEIVDSEVVEVGERSRRVWVVEDWVDGRALGDVLTDGPLTAQQAVALASGILQGLVAVHARGVVHGDVSPATIVVGAGGVPRLVGFGFAGLPGRPGTGATTDASSVATVLRDLLADAPSGAAQSRSGRKAAPRKSAHKNLDAVVAQATSDTARLHPAGAAHLLAALKKAARSDFGREWAATTSLAALAVIPPASPAAAADHETVVPDLVDQEPDGVPDAPATTPTPAPVAAAPAPAPVRDRPPSGSSAASSTWGDKAPAAPEVPAPPPERQSRPNRRPPRRELVRTLTGVILLLLGAATATAVERNRADSRPADGGGSDVSTAAGRAKAEVASSDIAGTWMMKLTVLESTGFFGTRTGTSVDKIYTITSDCSRTPCALTLVVSGQTGEFALHRQADGYLLDESGPNDCVDLTTGAVLVPNGGVAKVRAELQPSGAARTPRGDWVATGLTGSIVTTFDTTHPQCVRGSGIQRSSVLGTRT